MPRELKSDRIPSLDGLRAVSILLVISGHTSFALEAHTGLHSLPLKAFEGLSGLGVDTFFVISGFLITNLLLQQISREGRIDLVRFYLRRTMRLLPPYYVLIAIVALGYYAGLIKVENWHSVLVHALSYTTNYNPQLLWDLGHSWSLSVEEQFYLIWPAVLLLLGLRWGFWFAASLLLVCPFVRLHYSHLSIQPGASWNLPYRTEAVADTLAAGCLLARVRTRLCAATAYRSVQRSKFFPLIPAMVIVLNLLYADQFNALLGRTLEIFGIVLCVDRAMTITDGASKLLNSSVMTFIGGASYSLYLWQQPFLNPVTTSWIGNFPLNVILVVVASLCSHYLVERPTNLLRSRLDAALVEKGKGDKAAVA